ncbi:MAG: tetratricopeptide repeat protein [Spartobacteria bacterium]|nr:tetratricopeptide repeat protein [Spartobacteria bacterium]
MLKNRTSMGRMSWLVGMVMLLWVVGAAADTMDAPDTLFRRGMGAFSEGNFAQAVSAFQELIERFGAEKEMSDDLEKVYYALGCALYNENDPQGAITAFDAYVKKYPEARFKDEALFRIGAANQSLQNFEAAIEAYMQLLREFPRSTFGEDAAFQIGICYVGQDDHEKAVQVFQEFTTVYPDSPLYGQAAVILARALFENEKWEAALAALDMLAGKGQALDQITQANFLAMEIGDIAFDETDYDIALRAYRRVRTRESLMRIQRHVLDTYKTGLTTLMKQQVTGAEAAQEHFRQENRLKTALIRAEQVMQKLESTPGYDATLFHRIGRCFFNTDRFWEARVAFTRVVAVATDVNTREAAQFDLALVLSRQRRFNDLIAVADAYLNEFGDNRTFIENGRVPAMAFMRAEAYVNMEMFEEAEQEMRALNEAYPSHPQRPAISFYLALSIAMQERFDEGIAAFEQWQKDFPDNILNPDVEYWKAIAMYYNGQFGEALPLLTDYAERYPMSSYTPEAKYRAAMCMYSLEQYMDCALALGAWANAYPDHYFKWEAKVTRGDALAAEGMLERARDEYLSITEEAGPFYYMALTQCARVFKAMDTPEAYRDMAQAFIGFIHQNPDSGNIIDAAYQAGWALRQVDKQDEAVRLYWQILERHGNNRNWEGFEPIFDDLKKLYAGDGKEQFVADLRARYAKATKEKRRTLAARLQLAVDRAVLPPDGALDAANGLARTFKMDELGAEELAFIGETYVKAGETDKGVPYLERLIADFPESRYAGVAYTRLAEKEMGEENWPQALALAVQAEGVAYDPRLYMETMFVKAQSLQGVGDYTKAVEAFTVVLANRMSPRAFKPQALLRIGQCLAAQGETRKSIPYYQRVYVLYGAYPELVSQAYMQSGLAFEKLNDLQAAARTYQEMLANEQLAGLPEITEAKKRLQKIRL